MYSILKLSTIPVRIKRWSILGSKSVLLVLWAFNALWVSYQRWFWKLGKKFNSIFHCLLAMKMMWLAQATPISRRAGQGWTRLLRFAIKMVQIIVPTYGAVQPRREGGLIIFLLNNLKFPTVVQQIKSIGVSLWVGTKHWHVLVSASRFSVPQCWDESEAWHEGPDIAASCDHNWATCHNSHQMTWHQAKPASTHQWVQIFQNVSLFWSIWI